MIAAGINPESICRDPQWDRDRIIEAILLHIVQGDALGSTTVRPRTFEDGSRQGVRILEGGIAAAGLDPAQYLGQRVAASKEEKEHGWSKERVQKAILQRHALGLPLYGNSVRRDDSPLFFGGSDLVWQLVESPNRCRFRPSGGSEIAGMDNFLVRKSGGFAAAHGGWMRF